jgi:hypothetical protein
LNTSGTIDQTIQSVWQKTQISLIVQDVERVKGDGLLIFHGLGKIGGKNPVSLFIQ